MRLSLQLPFIILPPELYYCFLLYFRYFLFNYNFFFFLLLECTFNNFVCIFLPKVFLPLKELRILLLPKTEMFLTYAMCMVFKNLQLMSLCLLRKRTYSRTCLDRLKSWYWPRIHICIIYDLWNLYWMQQRSLE